MRILFFIPLGFASGRRGTDSLKVAPVKEFKRPALFPHAYRNCIFLLAGWVVLGMGAHDGEAGTSKTENTPQLVLSKFRSLTGCRNRFWEEAVVRIDNPGPVRDAQVAVEHVGHHSGQLISMSYPVRLGAQSTTLFDFPVWSDLEPPIKNKRLAAVLRVKLSDGGLVTWGHQDILAPFNPADRLRIIVSDARLISYKFLDGEENGNFSLVRSPVYNEHLPSRFTYYEGYDLMLLGATQAHAFTAAQEAALVDWVHGGGILLYTPGADGDVLTPGPLRDLLPVQYGVHHRVSRLEISEAESLTAPKGITRYRMLGQRGQVIRGSTQDPAVVRSSVGSGQVLAFNFDLGDPAFQQWEGALPFFQTLLPEVPAGARYGSRLLEEGAAMETLMGSLTGLRVLPRRKITLYLICVTLVLLVPLAVLHKGRQPERGWALLVGTSLLAGLGVILAARVLRSQPQPVLNEVYFAGTQNPEGTVDIQAALGLYAPSDQRFTFEGLTDRVQVRPGASRTRPPERFPQEYHVHPVVRELRVRSNDQRMLYGSALRKVARLPHSVFRLTRTGLTVTIENPSDFALQDPFVRINRLEVSLGSINPGGRTARKDILPQRATERAGAVKNPVYPAGSEVRNLLRKLLMPARIDPLDMMQFSQGLPALNRAAEWRKPGLYFWSDQPVFPLQTSSEGISRTAAGLWQIGGILQADPGPVRIPCGLLPMHTEQRGAGLLPQPDGSFSGLGPSSCVVRFALPEELENFNPTAMRACFEFAGEGFSGELLAVPVGQDGKNLDGLTPLGGTGMLEIEPVKKYYDEATRSVRLAFRVTRTLTPAAAPGTAPAAQVLPRWNIPMIDLELEGTIR